MNTSDLTYKLVETVGFNNQNFVEDDDNNIFYIKEKKEFSSINNTYIQKIERKKIELLNKRDILEQAWVKADELALVFFNRAWDLEDEMLQCGLQQEDIALIKKNSAGFYNVINFLQKVAPILSKESTIIGLDHKSIIEGLKKTLKCHDCEDAYRRIFNDFTARDAFLEKLTAEPYPIIFLVPHKLFGDLQGITAQEMKWLLNHPEQMKNVLFVFASYKIYSNKIITTTGLTERKKIDCYKETLTKRIFKQLQHEVKLPKKDFNRKIVKKEILLEKFHKKCKL